MRPLLEIERVGISYGKVEAVHNVSLRVLPGQIVTVIGPNAAGKTTLLGAAMGLLEEIYRLPMVPPREASRARIRQVVDALKPAAVLAASSGSASASRVRRRAET